MGLIGSTEMPRTQSKIGPGYQVGQLTVEADSGERSSGAVLWTCRCSCGGSIKLTSRALRKGTVRDCGCGTRSAEESDDLTGLTFGLLTVEHPAGQTDGKPVWHCRCSCGSELDVPAGQLIGGYRKSCGCLSRENGAPVSLRDIKPGYRFGRLTVESDSGKRKKKYRVWTCRCDCGQTIDLDARTIQRNTILDCGCVTRVAPGQKDITGMRFGKLVAQYPLGETKTTEGHLWHCTCDCGGEVDAPLQQLMSGHRASCGCVSSPPLKDYVGKTFGLLTVTGYAGKRNGSHYWHCRCRCGNTSTVSQFLLQSGSTISCGCIKADINRENLKLVDGTSVTILESHRGKLMKTNTSGYTGVTHLKNDRWRAEITFQGKHYYLGTYDKKEEAAKARALAEETLIDPFLEWYYKEYQLKSRRENAGQRTAADEPHRADRDHLRARAE